MPLSAYIALARDVLIVGALGYILWFIHHADANAAKVADLQGVVTQLKANAVQAQKWEDERQNAEAQRLIDNATVIAAVAQHNDPIRLCNTPRPNAVPGNTASASSNPPSAGGHDEGPGRDLRPKISAFERKYEDYFTACRVVLKEWPR